MVDELTITYVLFLAVVFFVALPDAVKSIRLYSRRDRFKCMMCGTCCRFKHIQLTSEDIIRLEAAGKKDFFKNQNGEKSLKRVRGRCVFVKDDKCTVHEIRPTVCRSFPFFKIYGIGYAQKSSFCPALDELQK